MFQPRQGNVSREFNIVGHEPITVADLPVKNGTVAVSDLRREFGKRALEVKVEEAFYF
jgi:hypothetical protein